MIRTNVYFLKIKTNDHVFIFLLYKCIINSLTFFVIYNSHQFTGVKKYKSVIAQIEMRSKYTCKLVLLSVKMFWFNYTVQSNDVMFVCVDNPWGRAKISPTVNASVVDLADPWDLKCLLKLSGTCCTTPLGGLLGVKRHPI